MLGGRFGVVGFWLCLVHPLGTLFSVRYVVVSCVLMSWDYVSRCDDVAVWS